MRDSSRQPVVSDTSPLILYSRIEHLSLLRQLFDEILIPPAVWDEIMVDGATRPAAREIGGASWIRRTALSRPASSYKFSRSLDLGEAEAIALALESRRASVTILTDDHPARLEATELGLTVVGSVGIALLAKRRGYIDQITPIIESLRAAGLYLSNSIVEFLAGMAGESQ